MHAPRRESTRSRLCWTVRPLCSNHLLVVGHGGNQPFKLHLFRLHHRWLFQGKGHMLQNSVLGEMNKTITIANRKYFRPFDNSDNPCCWQVDEVGTDIEDVLADAGIDAEVMYEDWGAAWSWNSRGVEHSMHLECTDVDQAEYRIACFAMRPKWFIFKADVPDIESDFGVVLPRLQQLNSTST